MKCPRCNAQLENNAIKCPVCGTRIGRLCPTCKTYNLITNTSCENCGEELLKICSKCGAINLPTSAMCRKCGSSLNSVPNIVEENISEDIKYSANYYTFSAAQDAIITSIQAQNIKVVSVNGNNELGKDVIFKKVINKASSLGVACLVGKCNPHTQLTPLGFFQNVLLNLFNVTNFCSNKAQLKRESIKFFKQDFDNLSVKEIYDLLNILYPENIDQFQNIENNKQNTIRIIVKIFETIVGKMNSILLVENIEYIDSFSYEILNILISNDFIREKLTLILSFAKEQSGINCLNVPCLEDNNYVDVSIMPFSKEQIEPIFNNYKNLSLEEDLKSKVLHYGNENPILIDQLINLVADSKQSKKLLQLSDTLVGVLKNRLEILKATDNYTYLILCACSILGYKFYPFILSSIFNMSYEQVEARINKLVKQNYLIVTNNSGYEFKSLSIWSTLIDLFKQDEKNFLTVNEALYPLISSYTLSTTAILGFISQNLNLEEQTFSTWTKCSQYAAYIGDTGLYIILQKQLLTIIDSINLTQKDLVKRTIYAELGKLLEPINTQLAIEYLPKAIVLLSDSDFIEKIELLGYLASCSMKLKNYHGVLECINSTIPLIPENFIVEVAMIKTREVLPLLKLGNVGEVINLIDNDIIPTLENALNNKIICKTIDIDSIFEAWINVNLSLAKALVYQGDNRVFHILDMLANTCKSNQVENSDLMIQINSALAFAYTIFGDIRLSIEILDKLLSNEQISPQVLSEINFTGILNQFFMNKDDLSYDELYQAAQYADNIGDDFTKNILKLLLGRLIQDRSSVKEAAAIYTKQIEYFADKQNAIGVLLGWYFISNAKMIIDGPSEALDIAVKALEISTSANISNHYFSLLLNKLIGEIYLAMQDFESAKMYIEKALIIAKNYNIKYHLASLYLLYSKYLQDFAMSVADKKVDYVLNAQQMIKKSKTIAEDIKVLSLLSEVEKAETVLNSFCQMNGIVLK